MKRLSSVLCCLILGMTLFNVRSEIIYQQPSGEVKTYDLSTNQHYQGDEYAFSGILSKVVFDDDEVWFENLLTAYGFNTWIKGKVEGNLILIESGQQIYHQDSDEENGYPELDIYAVSGTWNGKAAIPNPEEKITIYIRPDGTLWMPEHKMIIATDNYGGVLASNNEYMFLPVDIEKDQCHPSKYDDAQRYVMHYRQNIFNEDIYQPLDIIIDNNDFYIKGMCSAYGKESWCKGYRDGDYVHFPSRQLQGIVKNDFLGFMYGGRSDFSGALDGYTITDELVFSYDLSTQTLSSSDIILETIGDRILVDAYIEPEIKPYTPNEAYPAKPEIRYYTDYEEYGFRVFSFKISPLDIDGNYIEPAGITWRLLVDNKPYLFTTDKYLYLNEDKELFNWGEIDYDMGRDIVFESCGLYTIWLYDMDMFTIAVECTFTHDGKSHNAVSETLRFKDDGINDINDSEELKYATFHVDGTVADENSKGIIIKMPILPKGEKRSKTTTKQIQINNK